LTALKAKAQKRIEEEKKVIQESGDKQTKG
jgi:hypothetical protein